MEFENNGMGKCVVLKENKRVKKYQYADGKNVDINKKKTNETANQSEYIIKEAENVISHYITNLETKSPKWKNNFKKLEKKYKKSLKLNFALVFVSLISILISVI